MKNPLLMLVAAAAALFASCDKNDSPTTPVQPGMPDAAAVTITLAEAPGDETRAFFDTTAAAETWEKSLSSVCVLVFGADGRLLVQRNFTDSELSAKPRLHLIGTLREVRDLRPSEIRRRHRVLVLRRGELRCVVRDDEIRADGHAGEIPRGL